MAATAEGAALTIEHRRRQQQLAAITIRDALRLWPVLDPANIDGTLADWLSLNQTLAETHGRVSAALAGEYVQAFRRAEFDEVGTVTIVPAPVDVVGLRKALLVTGVRPLRLGQDPAPAQVAAAANNARLVSNAGRGTIESTVREDKRALGWARVTGGKPCGFCAMLASRGPVYKSEMTAEFHAHATCQCSAEPVYDRGAEWPGRAREFRETWDSVTRGLSGNDALAAFRAVIEA